MNHFKKIFVGVTLSFLLLSNPISTFASPISSDTKPALPIEAGNSSTVNLLTSEEILYIVDRQIDGYLHDDWQTKDLFITPSPSSNWIPLYDINQNIIAYMIPLFSGSHEIGYISVGALRDAYDAYDIFIDDSVVQSIRNQLSPPSIASIDSKESSKLVFVPPMTYMVQTTGDEQTRYYEFEEDFESTREVTEAVFEQQDTIEQQYNDMQNPQNAQHMQKILGEESTDSRKSLKAAAVTKEDYALTIEASQGRFVPIQTSQGLSYGGNQNWWASIEGSSTKAERGCGPVAAANITTYLAKITNPSAYRNLYSGTATSQTDFLAHMNIMYNYIKPSPFGEISVNGFASAVEKYAKDKNVKLTAIHDNSAFTLDNTASYIKNGLNINSPVATLNLSKFTDYDYEWHWMTITKYYRDVNDNRWIAVSTWGERRSINYRTHFDAITRLKSLGGGFMYFK